MISLFPVGVRCFACAAAGSLLFGCGSSGTQDNADRADSFTDILSEADRSQPSDLARHLEEGNLPSTATYQGVASARFEYIDNPKPDETERVFTGSADAALVADFENQTIRGRMANWEDGNPRTHDLRGEIVLSNGSVDLDEGTFSGLVTGNLERTELGQTGPIAPVNVLLDGNAEGEFYDSESGKAASRLEGGMDAGFVDSTGGSGQMTGGFVAGR